MDRIPHRDGHLELGLVDETPTSKARDESSVGVSGEREVCADFADEFLAKAATEYHDGRVDQPLWVRAVEQSGSDATLAMAAYLRARATALRLAERETRPKSAARRARASPGADRPDGVTKSRDGARSAATRRVEHVVAASKRNYLTLVAVALGCVAVAAWLIATPGENNSAQSSVVSAEMRPAGKPGPPRPGKGRQPAVNNAAPSANEEDPTQSFETKVRELSSAGNWNVLVLYASDWTRKEPTNASAWNQLSIGYANLRQFNDAYDAASKAVQLAPGDSRLWRNLGHVNLALKQPAAALDAFERATALNDQDVQSFVQIGMLNTELGRLPQANDAFDRALALSPENTDALCGEASIARRQGRPKDADAIARRLKLVDGRCGDLNDVGNVIVVGSGSAKYKPAPSGRR